MLATVDKKAKPALYQLLYYPVKGAELMNRMNMTGQLYRQYVRQKRAAADDLKREKRLVTIVWRLLPTDIIRSWTANGNT